VAESFKASLNETVGGGGTVTGYTGLVTIRGVFYCRDYSIAMPGMSAADMSKLNDALPDIVADVAKSEGAVDADCSPLPVWLGNRTVDQVKWLTNKAGFTTALKSWVDNNIPNYDSTQIVVNSQPQLTIRVSDTAQTCTASPPITIQPNR